MDFDADTISQFIHGRLSLSRIQGDAYQSFRESARPSQCQESLYTDPKYASLNTPIYMATDSHHPAKDPNLQLFFQTFPCIFVLSDFQDGIIPEMDQYGKLISKQDGLPLHTFLTPLLDAQVASKSGIGFVGLVNGCQSSMFVFDIAFLTTGHIGRRSLLILRRYKLYTPNSWTHRVYTKRSAEDHDVK